MEIYAFNYCYNRYESGYITMSLHKTKLGAYKAMRKHLVNEWLQCREIYVEGAKASKRYYYGDALLEDKSWEIETMHVEG